MYRSLYDKGLGIYLLEWHRIIRLISAIDDLANVFFRLTVALLSSLAYSNHHCKNMKQKCKKEP